VSRLRIAPIVEGRAEVEAVRILLKRIWYDLLGGEYIDILRPIYRPRSKFVAPPSLGSHVKPDEIRRACGYAMHALKKGDGISSRILLLLDAEPDCPKDLAPRLHEHMQRETGGIAITVLANQEFESWFVAAVESLGEFFSDADLSRLNDDREVHGKRWVQRHYTVSDSYSETIDQPKLTARFDLRMCRAKSRSFDKLCRDLEGML